MKSNISPVHYHQAAIFEKEKQFIFKKNWCFVGFRSQLANVNDFICRRIADVPVLIQNVKGEVRAFLNVCSHRFSLIQQDETGNRPMVCPYHGWAYDQEGVPTGIPKKPLFKEFTYKELCDMRLKQFQIEFCGNLCFVSIDEKPQSIRDYLGEFYAELEQMSMSLGNLVDINKMTINANWKIIVENTLESYHVNAIHASTFKKLGAQGLEFAFTPFHSNWSAELNVKRSDPQNRKIEDLFSARPYKIEGYKHILVFPNLLVSSTHGSSYNYSLIEPINESSTWFTSYVFTAVTSDQEKKALLAAFEKSLIDFNRQVFEEDKAICQVVQHGVLNASLPGVLSLEEERVHAFQKIYIKSIQEYAGS
ncbi:(2Fe-2S)-binding protein [Cytophagales bacterium WSM2-2]|nr:(2Fe-2S)-binding protein [Cytophagales bacterium WSM2-2]